MITRGATTFYFRHDFNVDSAGIEGLEINLRRDDGAIIYLNGTEIVRSNMPPADVDYQTFAMNAADDGQSLHTTRCPPTPWSTATTCWRWRSTKRGEFRSELRHGP